MVLERWDFVRDVANWFDAFLVAFGIIDILLFVQMSGLTSSESRAVPQVFMFTSHLGTSRKSSGC